MKDKALIQFDPPSAAPFWVHATAELEKLLRSPVAADCDLTVVLSAHFVRFAVLPWTASLSTRGEWLAYAQHTFFRTYGAAANSWQVTACGTGRKHPWIACAVDRALREALARIAREGGVRLVSVQPWLMTMFNRNRGAIKDGSGWFVLAERGRITVASLVGGAWESIRARNVDSDWSSELELLLEREAAVCGIEEQPKQVYVCTSEPLEDRGLGSGRYCVADLTLPRGTAAELRPYAAVLA